MEKTSSPILSKPAVIAPAYRVPAIGSLLARHPAASAIAVLALFPLVFPFYSLAINILLFGLFAAGYNLTFGYTGKLSFGHAAFFGSGAYGCGILISQFGMGWHIALISGVLLAGVIALAIGLLAMRTRGIYFAMVTLALAQCAYFLFFHATSLTGGDNGLRGVNVGAVNLGFVKLDLLNPLTKYYFTLVFVALAVWLLARILQSPFGAILEALRENEHRARACGVNVERTRLLSLVISGMICGLAGALNAINLSTVSIDSLSYHTSGQVMMMTLLGGMGTFFGPFIGAGMFLGIEHIVTGFTERWQMIVGVIFIVLVLFFPKGIWGTVLDWYKK
ncbi:branched-chain amino acid ABC transporter permease [Herbaspirillum sp. ST 5-3]|uniref:branched-chain amino acid ABC transporter permease n=1 Tax=Herbaspirillum sp. ST 5-3 TaxID=2567936 RepID=UPI0010A4D7A2|nr:branched-chain amino acid ABC transporter permease [Herbaspirillum sp. ST 5-3]